MDQFAISLARDQKSTDATCDMLGFGEEIEEGVGGRELLHLGVSLRTHCPARSAEGAALGRSVGR